MLFVCVSVCVCVCVCVCVMTIKVAATSRQKRWWRAAQQQTQQQQQCGEELRERPPTAQFEIQMKIYITGAPLLTIANE